MAFNKELVEKAAKEYKIRSVDSDFAIVEKLLKRAVTVLGSLNAHIKPSDVKIYLHGSYANKTNTYFPSKLEVAVELGRTLDYDPDDYPNLGFRVHNNYFVETTYEFNPSEFAQLLFMTLQEMTGGVCTLGDRFIEFGKGEIEGVGTIKHAVEILPCFTFKHREKNQKMVIVDETLQKQEGRDMIVSLGVLYFDSAVSSHIVTFPKLHASNGHGKDLATAGNFLRLTRLFKTLNTIGFREADFLKTRGYFVQCLLFNVPNDIFLLPNSRQGEPNGDELRTIFFKILNYLLYCDMENFVCQNLVWQLFGKAEEFWTLEEAKAFVKNIKILHDTFPSGRTELA